MDGTALSRRQFVLRSALGTAAAVAMPAVVPARALGSHAPSREVALGHIGVGGRGTDLMNGFLGIPGCRVVAVSDCFGSRRDAAVARADAHYGSRACRAFADFRELCARPDVDAVVVATPDHWHVPVAIEAVRSGKDVYVEKPLGLSIEQDKALRECVQRYGAVFQYGTQQRSQDHMRWVCEMVVNGRIGRLQAVEVECPGGLQGGATAPIPAPPDLDYDRFLGPAPARPYTADRCTSNGSYHISDFALGFIAGWGAHPLDIMVWGLGDTAAAVPVEVEGAGVFPAEGLFDTALSWDVRGRFADGKAFRFRGPGEDCTTFIGDHGRIAVSRSGIRILDPPSLRDERLRPGERLLSRSDNHGAAFIDSVKRRSRSIVPVEVACYSDFVSHLADIAIRTGRKVRWDPEREQIVGDPLAARRMHRSMRAPWRLE